MKTVDDSFQKMMAGYGLTTAQIFYYLPDARSILGEFIWQEYDIAPDFPKVNGFLEFWKDSIEGPLHSVVIVHQKLIKPSEIKLVGNEFFLQ